MGAIPNKKGVLAEPTVSRFSCGLSSSKEAPLPTLEVLQPERKGTEEKETEMGQ